MDVCRSLDNTQALTLCSALLEVFSNVYVSKFTIAEKPVFTHLGLLIEESTSFPPSVFAAFHLLNNRPTCPEGFKAANQSIQRPRRSLYQAAAAGGSGEQTLLCGTSVLRVISHTNPLTRVLGAQVHGYWTLSGRTRTTVGIPAAKRWLLILMFVFLCFCLTCKTGAQEQIFLSWRNTCQCGANSKGGRSENLTHC